MSKLDGLVTKPKAGKPRILVHGQPGVGKTTFFAHAKKPIFIQAEDGLDYVGVDVDVFPAPESMADINKYLNLLIEEDHSYATIVIDSVDWMQKRIYEEIISKEPGKTMAQCHGGYGKAYVKAFEDFHNILTKLNILRSKKDMTIGLIAHSKVKKFTDPRAESAYNSYDINLQENNNADIRSSLLEWVDICGFATKKTIFSNSDDKTKARQFDERELRFDTNAAYVAKTRVAMPPKIKLDWGEFVSEYKSSINKKSEEK